MDEALRLAYLAAMEIPVWVLRDMDDPGLTAEAAVEAAAKPPPAADAARQAVGRQLQELPATPAGSSAGGKQAAMTAAAPRKEPAGAAAGPPVAPLLLVMAGRFLFMAEAGSREHDARVATLSSAIGFALGGESGAATMQRFDPALTGMDVDRGVARDMLRGLLGRLTGSASHEHLVVLGPTAAASLLGWSDADYTRRKPTAYRVDGLDVDVLVTLDANSLLQDPAAKASAWHELSTALGGHGAG